MLVCLNNSAPTNPYIWGSYQCSSSASSKNSHGSGPRGGNGKKKKTVLQCVPMRTKTRRREAVVKYRTAVGYGQPKGQLGTFAGIERKESGGASATDEGLSW